MVETRAGPSVAGQESRRHLEVGIFSAFCSSPSITPRRAAGRVAGGGRAPLTRPPGRAPPPSGARRASSQVSSRAGRSTTPGPPVPARRGTASGAVCPAPRGHAVAFSVRSIPACAGKPEKARADHAPFGVHPRVCGETLDHRVVAHLDRGPSPRVRGNRMRASAMFNVSGSIPALPGVFGSESLTASRPARVGPGGDLQPILVWRFLSGREAVFRRIPPSRGCEVPQRSRRFRRRSLIVSPAM